MRKLLVLFAFLSAFIANAQYNNTEVVKVWDVSGQLTSTDAIYIESSDIISVDADSVYFLLEFVESDSLAANGLDTYSDSLTVYVTFEALSPGGIPYSATKDTLVTMAGTSNLRAFLSSEVLTALGANKTEGKLSIYASQPWSTTQDFRVKIYRIRKWYGVTK